VKDALLTLADRIMALPTAEKLELAAGLVREGRLSIAKRAVEAARLELELALMKQPQRGSAPGEGDK
jgi:hypothetical protein